MGGGGGGWQKASNPGFNWLQTKNKYGFSSVLKFWTKLQNDTNHGKKGELGERNIPMCLETYWQK